MAWKDRPITKTEKLVLRMSVEDMRIITECSQMLGITKSAVIRIATRDMLSGLKKKN